MYIAAPKSTSRLLRGQVEGLGTHPRLVTIDGSTGTGSQGVWIDRSTVNASNGLTVQSLNSRVLISGSTLTASATEPTMVQRPSSGSGASIIDVHAVRALPRISVSLRSACGSGS